MEPPPKGWGEARRSGCDRPDVPPECRLDALSRTYVIRRIQEATIGRYRAPIARSIIPSSATAEPRGMIDGPIRDPGRVIGNAADHRLRRASARWIATAPSPRSSLALALTPPGNCDN